MYITIGNVRCAPPLLPPSPPLLLLLSSGAVGKQLSLQLSDVGARLILSGLPAEEAAMVELKQNFPRQQDVK